MKVSFEGIGEQVATFEAVTSGDTAVTPGTLVLVSGNGTVKACAKAGDIPAGVVLSARDGCAAVQIGGYVKVPCASGLTVGWQAVAADASGALAKTTGGRGVLVTDVSDGVCGVIL